MLRRGAAAALAVVLFATIWPAVASAHDTTDLFRVHVYARLEPAGDRIDVHYVMDMAEIQSFNEFEQLDADGDGEIAPVEHQPYLQRKAAEIAGALQLAVDGHPVALGFESGEMVVQTSAYNTLLLRLELRLSTTEPLDLGTGTHEVLFVDQNVTGAIGIREIVVTPDPLIEYQAAPSLLREVTAVLTALEPGAEPPRVTEAEFAFSFRDDEAQPAAAAPAVAAPGPPASEAVAIEAAAVDAGPTGEPASAPRLGEPETAELGVDRSFGASGGGRGDADAAQLVTTTDAGIAALMVALVLATGFGALHALEPGHGKTLVAAYFVGTRGTVAQAFTLGAVIASSHTVGVLVIVSLLQLGAGLFVPEVVLPMFGVASGVAVVVIGALVLRDGLRGREGRGMLPGHWHLPGHGHAHAPEYGHGHGRPHTHGHRHERALATHGDIASTASSEERPPWRRLFALGIVDGFVPTPSTIVMLLAAISLGKLIFGVLLVAAFGIGFGAVIGAIALALVLGRRLIGRSPGARSARLEGLGRTAAAAGPFVASAVLIVSGVFLAARAVLVT